MKCCICKQEKNESEFYNNRYRKTGKDSLCKNCRKESSNRYDKETAELKRVRNKAYYANNRERLLKERKEYILKNKEKISATSKLYYSENKEKRNSQTVEWQKRNPEKLKEIRKRTVDKNWDKILLAQRERRARSPKCRIMNRMRSGFKGWLNGRQKKCSVTDLIGLSKDDFILYIESLFVDGMTWDNIHIDHYVPLSYFDPTNDNDMKVCWCYMNLRPLLAKDNISKNNIIPDNYKEHIEAIKKYLTTAST